MTRMRRHRFIILALTALAAVSCVEIQVDDGPDVPIDFNWYALSGVQATKVDADYFVGSLDGSRAERHLNAGTSFGVFGYFHPQPNPNPEPKTAGGWVHGARAYNAPNLFYNEPVTIGYNAQSEKYSYSYEHSRYWPKNIYDRISFFAYYPYFNTIVEDEQAGQSNNTIEPILDTNRDREGLVAFYYTAPRDAENHVDFMVSDLCLDQSRELWKSNHAQGLTIGSETGASAETGTVKFFFHHALSQIRIRPVDLVEAVSNPNVTVTLKSARFVDVAVSGRCIPEADFANVTATGRTPVTPTWPARFLSTQRPGEHAVTGVTTESCYDAQGNLDRPQNILMMIPQTFSEEGSATIEVIVDVVRWKNINDKGYLADGVTPDPDKYEYYFSDYVYNVPLYSGVDAWLPGKIYTYSLSLNLKAIRMTAEVVENDWLTANDDVFMDPVVTPAP